jgi:hypothetical protein
MPPHSQLKFDYSAPYLLTKKYHLGNKLGAFLMLLLLTNFAPLQAAVPFCTTAEN